MKYTIFLGTLLVSGMAMADHHEAKKGEKFEDHKAQMLEKIDKRMEMMGNHKKCVSAAKDKAALKECRGSMKQSKKARKKARKKAKKKM